MTEYFVNGINIKTLFRAGTAGTGLKINNEEIKFELKSPLETVTVQETKYKTNDIDFNSIYKNINYIPVVNASSSLIISTTGSTPQFPATAGYSGSLYITSGSGTFSFDSNVIIKEILCVGGGGGGNTQNSSIYIGNGGSITRFTGVQPVVADTIFTVTIGEGGNQGASGTASSCSCSISALSKSANGGATYGTTPYQGTPFLNNLYYGGSGCSTTKTVLGGGGGYGGNGSNIYQGGGNNGQYGGPGGGISATLTGGDFGRSTLASDGLPGSNSLYGGGGGGGGSGGDDDSNGNRGGGAGGSGTSTSGTGGGGGGGLKSAPNQGGPGAGGDGGKNTGGGGGAGAMGGAGKYARGGKGGSGIVIFLYSY
jgi:hypothetical protein